MTNNFSRLRNHGDTLIARKPDGSDIKIILKNPDDLAYPKSAIPLPKQAKRCLCCAGSGVNHDEIY